MAESTTAADSVDRPRAIRYQQAALLLKKWLADEGKYDLETWQHLEPELRDSTMQCEDRDENPA